MPTRHGGSRHSLNWSVNRVHRRAQRSLGPKWPEPAPPRISGTASLPGDRKRGAVDSLSLSLTLSLLLGSGHAKAGQLRSACPHRAVHITLIKVYIRITCETWTPHTSISYGTLISLPMVCSPVPLVTHRPHRRMHMHSAAPPLTPHLEAPLLHPRLRMKLDTHAG